MRRVGIPVYLDICACLNLLMSSMKLGLHDYGTKIRKQCSVPQTKKESL